MPLAEQRGGAEMMLLRLLCANASGPKVPYAVGFLEDGPMVQTVKEMGYEVEVFRAGHLRESGKYLQTVVSLSLWMKSEKVSSVLSWMEKAHFYGSPAACLARIPSAYFLHSIPGSHWTNRIAPWFPTNAILCCGESVRKAQALRSPRRPTRLAYIAVDLEKFDPNCLPSPAESRLKLGLGRDAIVIGIAARLQRWKGVHTFLKAAALVAETHPEVIFLVVGGVHESEPEYALELRKQVDQDGIASCVRFVGHQTNIPLWMQAMGIIVHCSDNEPTGTVIIEGMALGKPVIAARTAGPMEFVTDRENGLLVQPGDAGALGAALNLLLDDTDLREKIAQSARPRAMQFGPLRLANDVASHLQEISLRS